ncbi:MAG: PA14 domain-containing protein [Saprospiraceae bacterium]
MGNFFWGNTYTLVVSTSNTYTNPVINQSSISSTSYTPTTALANNTQYYWKVTAVNSIGSTIATNAGIAFTTSNVSNPPPPTGEIYEAESINRANVTTATTYSGYSGAGYVTNFTSEWSYIKFERSYSQTTAVQLNIRYANGTGTTITNLELTQGSQKIADLSFPPTASWSTWEVLSLTFNVPVGYQGISVEGRVNAAQSVNIDYLELITGSVTVLPGAFSQTAPAANATGISTTPVLNWGASSNANSYNLVVSTNSSFTNPVINQTGITATSYTIGTALANNTTYYWKVTAVNNDGSTNASNAGIAFTTAAVTPAPGAFTQTSPPSSGTGISTTPSFSWQASSNATSYALVVSTSSTYVNPIINVANITSTSYSPGTVLSSSTQYYWKVTASNSSGSTVASNAGITFTTGTQAPPSSDPGVIREYWAGIPGSSVSDLTSNSNYPNTPTSTSILSTFDAPRNVAHEYGQRIRGYLAPTVTGNYEFWIASDDNSELWLSTNDQPANKVKIAYVNGWANAEQFDKDASQKSASINLVAGNYYYIEALQKDAYGDDHLTVAWKISGGTRATITSANLVTFPPVPVPQPGTFSQTAPASAATNVSLTPNFTWGTATDAFSYTLTVATNSAFTNPVINVSGLTTTSYTHSAALQGGTTYYWKVTAVNTSGSRNANNAGISFTTLVPPPPGAFTQTAPANNATEVSRSPQFTWAAASNASTYSLIVSTNSNYSSPVINVTGLTGTSYTHSTNLAGSTQYYWKVTAVNSSGSTVATNAGIAFTTKATVGTYYYVSPTGVDAPSNGTAANPWKTLAYAASRVAANQNNTIYLNPGTYTETQAVIVPTGVNIEGAGESQVTIRVNGPIAPPPGVDQSSADWKLWYYGSLIQLYSAGYEGGAEVLYGSPTQMVASSNGNQTLSGFTIDGNNKQLKAGVWVQNRNNVTMHHVTINNCEQRGAVFTRSDMWWYEPMPDGKWMYNTTIHNCTFNNNGAQLGSESLGNLCIAGLDGADIYNINIQDNVGYGIKFIMVGHYRNVKIHDCNITVNENDAAWGEKISIELWNLDQGNEVYNIVCNTWHSYVNHPQLTAYEPTGTSANNLKIYNVRMVDSDGSSGKEAIEAALSGVQIYDCYIQDKGFGIAIWNGSGQALKKNYIIRNNIRLASN